MWSNLKFFKCMKKREMYEFAHLVNMTWTDKIKRKKNTEKHSVLGLFVEKARI